MLLNPTMLAVPAVPPARVVPPHEKAARVSAVVMLLPAVPAVVAVTVTTAPVDVAVTSVLGLLLIAIVRFAAAVVVLVESAKSVPEVDAAEIEPVGDKVWLLDSDQVIALAEVFVTITTLAALVTAVAPGLADDTLHAEVLEHELVIASSRLVASVVVLFTRTTHPDVAVGVNAVQVVVVHVYVTPSMTVVAPEPGSLIIVSVPTPVAVSVTPFIVTVVPAAEVAGVAKVPVPVAATGAAPAKLVL